ncbi:MAG: hypothetical protein KF774_09080 [Planctomyces sp.]|nr:hypothetical protein [Planctomyces sp.]
MMDWHGLPTPTDIGFGTEWARTEHEDALDAWCDLDAPRIVTIGRTGAEREACLPAHYEPGYRYPLIVWLQSPDRAGRMETWLPRISERNAVSVAVEGPVLSPGGMGHRRWSGEASAVAAAARRIDEAVAAACEEFSIHSERVYLAGAGTAGAMALSVGMTSPQTFAGVAAIDPGPVQLLLLLRDFRRMRGRRACLAAVERAPSPHATIELADLLETAGVELEHVDAHAADDPHRRAASALNAWMMRHITAAAA